MSSGGDHHGPSNAKVALVAMMLIVTVLALFSLWFHGCAKKSQYVQAPQAPAPSDAGGDDAANVNCDDEPLGSIRDVGCDAGEQGAHKQVCQIQGWVDIDNTCRTPPADKPDCGDVVTFDELQPLISLNCAGCHAGYDSYAKAKEKSPEMVRRLAIPPGQPGHMPAGRPALAERDQQIFKLWASDGFLGAGDCVGSTTPGREFLDFAGLEAQIFTDIGRVALADQPDVRYLIATDLLNLGDLDAVAVARQAASKASNSVSGSRILSPVKVVGAGLWRISLRDLALNADDWALVEDHSQLQFESFTQTGLALKRATQSRLPWMNVADFNDTALRNANVYYALTRAPTTLAELQAKLGVRFAEDLANFRALLVGFNGSALSPAANRLISRHQSNDGFFWATYDTGPIVSDEQNLFRNPLLAEAGGLANLKFAAGEQLYTMPNGLIGSFLANAAGARLNEADANVVHDFTTNPLSPIIHNAISCFRCHSGGMIPAVDRVRAGLAASGIGAADTQRALALYKVQTTVDAAFGGDNSHFQQALAQLGIDPGQPDPISKVSDRFLGEFTLETAAALFLLRAEEFRECILLSPDGRAQAGQLLSGGSVSHDQIVQAAPALIADCRIFQDPLSEPQPAR